jgi:phosphoribosylglycinamide formyltransferase 1
VQQQEHVIYPLAVKWFAQGELKMTQGKAELKGELLPACGYQIRANES